MTSKALYEIGLTKINGLGPIQAKQLLSRFQSAEQCFKENARKFEQIEGFGEIRIQQFQSQKNDALASAQLELDQLAKYPEKRVISISKSEYPNRLRYCDDSPIVLYGEGHFNLNQEKVLAMVGTRKLTDYGRDIIKNFLYQLKDSSVLIISGLAYGTDTFVHKTCVEYGIENIGVLAHGLDRLYPNTNKSLANQMKEHGGLLTEYGFGMKPNRENFPSRNRIIAGLADATIVVESDVRGGSLITAEIANSYKRDVFAFPGDIGRQYSAGCNWLIKQQNAILIEHFDDVCFQLGWHRMDQTSGNRQRQLFLDLSDDELKVTQILNDQQTTATDISIKSGLPLGIVHTVLLNLELKGVVRIAPGNKYALN